MDFLWPAIVAGGIAVFVIVICFGYLTYENVGSKTFLLAAAALASALLVFCIQAYFELQPSETKTFITIEYTVDRAKPEIRQWDYGRNLGWRIHTETEASKVYTAAHPGDIDIGDENLSHIRKLMLDLAIVSTLSYLGNEQFDWQLKKIQYRGRSSGTMTWASPTSKPDECTELTSAAVREMLEHAGNSFATAQVFLRPKMCLPPRTQVEVGRASIRIKTRLLWLDFNFDTPGGGDFRSPNGDQHPVLKDGKPQFITSFVGLDVATKFSGVRSQSREMPKYKEWAARVVEGAQQWFEGH
jgi:hypothetical protein